MKNKTLINHWTARAAGSLFTTGWTAAVLLSAGPVLAGEKLAVTDLATTISMDNGQRQVSANGNVHLHGMKAVYILEANTPLLSGRLTIVGDFNGDADLNGFGAGTATLEVGTWDFSSGKPVFIPSPTGGMFVDHWQLKGNVLGPYTLSAVGHGIAGEVDGMQYNVEAEAPNAFTAFYVGFLLDPHAKQ